mmetsp:Transcript_8050/g.12439  ORF Transcript_8050/g.12439 Transcript_8050/m.12439 type:complete len:213 (+) Transcript_8050:3602-4240(+)
MSSSFSNPSVPETTTKYSLFSNVSTENSLNDSSSQSRMNPASASNPSTEPAADTPSNARLYTNTETTSSSAPALLHRRSPSIRAFGSPVREKKDAVSKVTGSTSSLSPSTGTEGSNPTIPDGITLIGVKELTISPRFKTEEPNGNKDGIDEGMELGPVEGPTEGTELGAEDGISDGLTVGPPVGPPLGLLLGAELGLSDGTSVGPPDGLIEG